MAKVSMSYLFSSQDMKQNVLLSSYLNIKFLFKQLMASQTLRFTFDQAFKHWLTRRKGGEGENTKA